MKNLIYFTLIIAVIVFTNCASTNTTGNDTFIGHASSSGTTYIPSNRKPVTSEELSPVTPERETIVVERTASVVSETATPIIEERTTIVIEEETPIIVPKTITQTTAVTQEIAPTAPEREKATDFWNRKKTSKSESQKVSDIPNEIIYQQTTEVISEPVLSDRRSTPVTSSDEVYVYYLNKSFIPKDSKSLAKAAVTGANETNDCDSLSVVETLKDYALQVGGNAVYISKHEKPSMWTIPCHRMEATIYNVTPDFTGSTKAVKADRRSAVDDAYITSRKRSLLPKAHLTLEGGVSYWNVKKDSYMSEINKSLSDNLKWGPSWEASFDYFFSKNWGIGVAYSGFTSSAKVTGRYTKSSGDFVDTKYENNVLFTYVGPRVVVRAPLGERWLFDAFLGAGYLTYQSPYKIDGKKSTQKENMLGGQLGCHLEYRLSRYFGITARVGSEMALDKQFLRENFNQNKKDDLLQVNGMLGIRFHLF